MRVPLTNESFSHFETKMLCRGPISHSLSSRSNVISVFIGDVTRLLWCTVAQQSYSARSLAGRAANWTWGFATGCLGWEQGLGTSVGRVLIAPCSWIWSLAPHKPGVVVHVHRLNPGEVRQMGQKFKINPRLKGESKPAYSI